MNFFLQNDEMPYERFQKLGPQALSESELLAIILRSGNKQRSAYEIASEVLSVCKSKDAGIRGLFHLSLDDLKTINGIGDVKAIQLKALGEICNRMCQMKDIDRQDFRTPESIVMYYRNRIHDSDVEQVYLMCLDNKGRLLQDKMMSQGSVRMSLIPPREIFIEALHQKAVHIVLVHNHPSGDPTPSTMDKRATAQIKQLGDLLDVPLLDHIILGNGTFYSFRLEEAL